MFLNLSVAMVAILLGSSMAVPTTSVHSNALEERGTTTVVTEALLKNMRFYVQYAAASYCNTGASAVGTKVTCINNGCPLIEAANVKNYAYLGYDQTQVQGFVAIDYTNKVIVVTFEGSRTINNWIINFIIESEECDLVAGCSLHAGFKLGWEDLQSMTIAAVKTARAANPSFSVIATGHSQGGAIAILACTYFRVNGIPCDIYSFGSPRVGNSAFSNFVNNQVGSHFRVTHTNDPVPNLPTSWFGWRHSGTEFWLSTGTSNTMAYELKDVVVCAGIDNNDCNGSTKSLDLLAHQTYFQNVQACL